MLTKFWETIAVGVGQKWLERIFSPALVFWLVAILTYGHQAGFDKLEANIRQWPIVDQILWLIGVLAVVAASASVVESVRLSILRLLEGYWPKTLGGLRRRRTAHFRTKRDALKEQWRSLARRFGGLTDEERSHYRALDRQLLLYPEDPARTMPTRLGNVLVSGEVYIARRYGVPATLTWSRLWLLLPEEIRKELTGARDQLDRAVGATVWSGLLLVWAMWSFVVIPLAVVGVWWHYRRAVVTATAFSQLLCASYDVYLPKLFEAMGRKVEGPITSSAGNALALFLRRGE